MPPSRQVQRCTSCPPAPTPPSPFAVNGSLLATRGPHVAHTQALVCSPGRWGAWRGSCGRPHFPQGGRAVPWDPGPLNSCETAESEQQCWPLESLVSFSGARAPPTAICRCQHRAAAWEASRQLWGTVPGKGPHGRQGLHSKAWASKAGCPPHGALSFLCDASKKSLLLTSTYEMLLPQVCNEGLLSSDIRT